MPRLYHPRLRAARIKIGSFSWNNIRSRSPALPSLGARDKQRALAGGSRHLASEWRAFLLGPTHRPYALLGLGQGGVAALSGAAVTIPLLISAGLGAGLATLVSVTVFAGPAAQLFVPALLRRSGGRLRRMTLASAAIGETRGLWLAPLALLAGLNPGFSPLLIAGVILATTLAGIFSGVTAANLQVWFAAALPESERRLVAPRVSGLGLAIGALVLLPTSIAVGLLQARFGAMVFVIPFLAAGAAGLLELVVLVRLPNPGRVRVPRLPSSERRPELPRFLRAASIAAFGSGLAPYYSVYAMAGLGVSAGVAIAISAFTSGVAVVASIIAAVLLVRRSSSRLLRRSYLLLGAGWLLMLGALPVNPWALVVMLPAVGVISAGGALTQLATNERLMRLAGRDAIAFQGRFVAVSAGAVTLGQSLAGALLVAAPGGALAFGALFVASGAARLLAAHRLEVSEVSTATLIMPVIVPSSR